MTGFGKIVAELPNKKVTVELKSLNSKQLDLNLRIHPLYREKEMQLRNELMQNIERGKIDLTVTIDCIGRDTSVQINQPVLENYLSQVKEVAERMHLNEPSDWFLTLLRLPEIVKTDVGELDETEWEAVHTAFVNAMGMLNDFRVQEGEMLERFFAEKIGNISQLLKEVDPYEEERIEKIRVRISDSLNKFAEIEYDKTRFEQEMMYYIDKLDINEEKSRLDNHLKYFIDTMENGHCQGKKLGFIAQEIGREINTLGSKSNHLEIQKIVVRMKDELEQIKEQLLNVL